MRPIDLLLSKDGKPTAGTIILPAMRGLSIRPVYEKNNCKHRQCHTAIYPTGATLGRQRGQATAKSTISMGMIYGTASTLSAASGTKVASSSTSYGTYTVDFAHPFPPPPPTITVLTHCVKNEYTYGDVKSFTTPAYESAGDAIDLGLSVKWAKLQMLAQPRQKDMGGYYGWG
jgi:hypothetical protein